MLSHCEGEYRNRDGRKGKNIVKRELSFVEPDYQIIVDTYENKKVMVDWIFHLWDEEEVLSANSFIIVLDTEETAQMAEYLRNIIR